MPDSRPTRPGHSRSRSIVGRSTSATPAKPISTVATRRASTRAAPTSTAPPMRNSAIHTDDM
jgi:hypothetical protein